MKIYNYPLSLFLLTAVCVFPALAQKAFLPQEVNIISCPLGSDLAKLFSAGKIVSAMRFNGGGARGSSGRCFRDLSFRDKWCLWDFSTNFDSENDYSTEVLLQKIKSANDWKLVDAYFGQIEGVTGYSCEYESSSKIANSLNIDFFTTHNYKTDIPTLSEDDK